MRVRIRLVLLVVVVWLLCGIHPALANEEEAALLAAHQRGEVIRLHILADSDLPEAQRVKLCVRDAVLEAFGALLSSPQSADEAYRLLTANAEAMREVAEACARENGFYGEVGAEVGLLELPEKRYGGVTLPRGEYRALRITLGSGEGQNWWCVLFPKLCLAVAEDGEGPGVTWNALRILRCWTAQPS